MARRGRFSKEEEDYVKKNAGILSVKEIANNIDRLEETVQIYLKTKGLVILPKVENDDSRALLNLLHSRSYWPMVVEELTDNELVNFQNGWCEFMEQFQSDVTTSEDKAIRMYLTTEIQINRLLKARKQSMDKIERLEKELHEEKTKTKPNKDRIENLENVIELTQASLGDMKNYKDLLERLGKLEDSLKMARKDRIQRIENSNQSWVSLLRSLQDRNEQKKFGRELELMRVAKDKAKEELSKFHEYADGVDRPILTTDTITEEDLK